ncbi:MAG TPA: CotS family spore coat protein [Bacillota bacterium]|nr:CotS family spore coat protein [Bacillota bacterium]HOL08526.1 CotS family spore coat protein [Bacillota bacterium]HPO96993.1 CotS family spore coat protein [Bacillota bacterium]
MYQAIDQAIPKLLSNWGLSAIKWQKVKDVYRVETDQGLKNLKISPLNPQRLLFVHQAIQYISNKGFSRMVPLIPTLTGETYVAYQDLAFSLFDWIEGRQCDFQNLNELAEATQRLAEFHQKTAGFVPPPNSNMRNQLGKTVKHFEERYQNLLDFVQLAKTMKDDPFAKLYLEQADLFIPMAELALTRLKNSNYQWLVQVAKLSGKFCHGDPAARNFILTPANTVYLIDFDSCRWDMPIMDLIKFTRRVMKKYNWDVAIAKLIFDAYQEEVRLNQSELNVIKAIFYFPQKFWRIAVRYFHQHNHHSLKHSLQKLTKFVNSQKNFAQFQREFDNYEYDWRKIHV